jgi:hypothetical protein
MIIVNASAARHNYNRPLYGNAGEFTLSRNVTVPYFTTIIDIKRAVSELKTHEQVAPSLEQIYNLKELFQRQIDHKRVERDLVDGFLKNPQKIKFFNSLTIALLPKSDDGHIMPKFDDYEGNDPQVPWVLGDAFDQGFAATDKILFGGVQLHRADISPSGHGIARLRWDVDRVDAVAVDGQHRLSALQKWFDSDRKKALEPYEQNTRIPIIILLLDARAGFKAENKSGLTIKSIAREIFTDLNKNAKAVDKATEIILDDRSLTSSCVRLLVTDKTTTDEPPLLPLSLVRWKEANYRFDQEHYINSLVHLNLLVESLLDLPTIVDPLDKSEVLDYIREADAHLGLAENAGRLVSRQLTLEDYYKDNFLVEGEPVTPFTGMPSEFMQSALDGFGKKIKPWLLTCITEFAPYKEFLSHCRKVGLVNGVFSQYLAQPEGHQKQLNFEMEKEFGINWKNDLIEAPKKEAELMKLRGSAEDGGVVETWAFKAIFQKAFVHLAKVVVFEYAEEREKFGDIREFVDFFDVIYARGLLDIHTKINGASMLLWTFIALNPASDTIKVNRRTEKRITALLALWYFGFRALKASGRCRVSRVEAEGALHVDDLVRQLSLKTQSEWPTADYFKDIKETYTNAAWMILGREKDEVGERESAATAMERIRALLYEALQHFELKSAAADTIEPGEPIQV